jgi:hypothetical protein
VFLERKNQVKLLKNKLFINDKGQIIRIVSIVKNKNIINIYNYTNFQNETMEYDTATYYLTPVFRIGEVAKIINRKPDTIRKYENSGLIPKVLRLNLSQDSKSSIRVYTLKDLYNLMEILSMRNSYSGQTSFAPLDQQDAIKKINARFQKIKNVGG